MRFPVQLISAIALISVLSLVSGIPLLQATAAPMRHPTALLATSYPKALSWRVRKDLARRVGIPTHELRVIEAERKTWGDGCFELAKPDEFCTQQLVEGWRVVVAKGDRTWVYHTDLQGRSLRLADLKPRERLPQNVVFRSRLSGGFAGQTYDTVLLNDGTMQQAIAMGGDSLLTQSASSSASLRAWKVSPQKVQEFRELLKREQFQNFNRKTYSPPQGAADFFIMTLTSPEGTVEYADIEEGKLPRSLQTIIQAWNTLK
ncbi:MAG: hypothetical protein MUC48_03240 [Leptolyngbya sp. Prado105]|jgi:hypothetical protein|nr:hypothetical protein [Leptolyngbya sp. Prado105]